MTARRKAIICYRTVNWLLILTVLVAVFMPVHYHLHHLDAADSAVHSHVVDLHLLSGDINESSHHEYGATSFSAVPDNAVKIRVDNASFVLLAVLLAIIPVFNKLLSACTGYQVNGRQQKIPHFKPLLRAPPLN